MSETDTKLLVIGFDALDHEILRGRDHGDFRVFPLYSPLPATGPGWTSIYTGNDAAHHNVRDIWGFETSRRYARSDFAHGLLWRLHQLGRIAQFKKRRERYATPLTTQSKHIWRTLNETGHAVTLLNLPITCPIRPVDGVHVAGFPVVKRFKWFHPDAVAPRIPDDYTSMIDLIQWLQDPWLEGHGVWQKRIEAHDISEVKEKSRADAFRLLDLFLALPRAPFAMLQFSFVDRFGHVYGIQDDVATWCYDLVDELVARLRACYPSEAVMIVSDHGFQGPEHTDYGCLAVQGSLAERINPPDGYCPVVIDVAPTIAAFFGTHHPCDGNDLATVTTPNDRSHGKYAEEKAEIIERMRDLGYM